MRSLLVLLFAFFAFAAVVDSDDATLSGLSDSDSDSPPVTALELRNAAPLVATVGLDVTIYKPLAVVPNVYSRANNGGNNPALGVIGNSVPGVTYYHITAANGWAGRVAAAKGANTAWAGLNGDALSPDVAVNIRLASRPGQGGRSGDDLGPGFYVTDSLAFVKYYIQANFNNGGQPYVGNAYRVMQFTYNAAITANPALSVLTVPDTNAGLNQVFTPGFSTTKDGTLRYAFLDSIAEGDRRFDAIYGPIADIATTRLVNRQDTDNKVVQVQETTALILGPAIARVTPHQVSFTTVAGCRAAYTSATAITALTPAQVGVLVANIAIA